MRYTLDDKGQLGLERCAAGDRLEEFFPACERIGVALERAKQLGAQIVTLRLEDMMLLLRHLDDAADERLTLLEELHDARRKIDVLRVGNAL